MMNFLFLRKFFLKNQMQIFFVAIVLFLLFLDSLVLLSSIMSQKFFISPDYLKALTLFL